MIAILILSTQFSGVVQAAGQPLLGAHVLLAQNDTFGTNPAMTPPITTQSSGSTLLALSMGWLRNLSSPMDSFGNTWTPLSGPNTYFSPDFYAELWTVPSAHGGSGHTLTFEKDDYPAGEISMAMVEVKNGGRVDQVYKLAPGSNQSPGSITVDGPATLIAIWGGDSGALDHTAVPDNGFTVIDSYLDFGNDFETAVQVAIASKQVTAAGTYTVKWTSTPTQNCACYLIAVQNSTPPADNLIVNPSLETAGTGGDPVNWLRGGFGANVRALTYPVAGEAGAKAARVDITAYTDGNAKWYFKDVPVSPGKTYAFSDYYKSSVPSTVGAQFKMTDGTFTYGSTSQSIASPSGWSLVRKAITVPANVTSLTVFHSIAKIGYLITDDFSLSLAPGNLIVNPSLETAGTGGNPASWLRGGFGTNTRTLTYPAAGQDGAKAARVDITSYANGNAKWYFANVPVTPGKTYAFFDYYQSNIPSTVGAQFKMTDGSFTYGSTTQSAASAAGWSLMQKTIVIPANVASVTVFHSIARVGYLTTDHFSLTLVNP